jgi:hypothetical protein
MNFDPTPSEDDPEQIAARLKRHLAAILRKLRKRQMRTL